MLKDITTRIIYPTTRVFFITLTVYRLHIVKNADLLIIALKSLWQCEEGVDLKGPVTVNSKDWCFRIKRKLGKYNLLSSSQCNCHGVLGGFGINYNLHNFCHHIGNILNFRIKRLGMCFVDMRIRLF